MKTLITTVVVAMISTGAMAGKSIDTFYEAASIGKASGTVVAAAQIEANQRRADKVVSNTPKSIDVSVEVKEADKK